MFGSAPSLQSCADALKTEIETRYKGYSSIAIVAHSQGGLIARWHIAERINSGRPLLVDRLLTFASPHHGAGGASVLRWIPGASRQTKALDPIRSSCRLWVWLGRNPKPSKRWRRNMS